MAAKGVATQALVAGGRGAQRPRGGASRLHPLALVAAEGAPADRTDPRLPPSTPRGSREAAAVRHGPAPIPLPSLGGTLTQGAGGWRGRPAEKAAGSACLPVRRRLRGAGGCEQAGGGGSSEGDVAPLAAAFRFKHGTTSCSGGGMGCGRGCKRSGTGAAAPACGSGLTCFRSAMARIHCCCDMLPELSTIPLSSSAASWAGRSCEMLHAASDSLHAVGCVGWGCGVGCGWSAAVGAQVPVKAAALLACSGCGGACRPRKTPGSDKASVTTAASAPAARQLRLPGQKLTTALKLLQA